VSDTEDRAGDVLTLVRTAPAALERAAPRVAVLSGHPVTLAGLTHLLSSDSRRASVVSASTGDRHGTSSHDVVVYELSEDQAGPLAPIPHDLAVLVAEGVPVVALVSRRRSALAEAALAVGVVDIVHLDISGDQLLQAVERAAAGERTTVAAYRLQRSNRARTGTKLTDREITVLELVGAGLLNQDIADRLYLSLNTVKTYIRLAYRKIGVTRRSEAVLWAVRHDLTPRPSPTPVGPAARRLSDPGAVRRPSRPG
jgi:DNA-binding NarL/FixJ family response regulator